MELNFNGHVSIQYVINFGVCSHKRVLCNVSTDGIILVIEKGTPTAVTNSYEALLTQFFPDKVYIDAGISKILSDNPLVKVHPKIISRDK